MDPEIYYPDNSQNIVNKFLECFGGSFYAHAVGGGVIYIDKNNNEYYTPETKVEFINLFTQSIKKGRNLFLYLPRRKLPPGVIE